VDQRGEIRRRDTLVTTVLPPVRGLHHIGYWVDDLSAAVAWSEAALGAGPFTVLEHIDLGDSFRFRGEPAVLDHSAAFGQWGSVIIELNQAHEVTPALALELRVGHGNVSHVSWTTDDLAVEAVHMELAGCPLLTTSRSGAWADWFEGGPVFGHAVEIHQPTAGVLGMWDGLGRAAAAAPRSDEAGSTSAPDEPSGSSPRG
jgi:catechol 2,3-dioxygenase-like lactoylglutathione lyase family enzyme